MLKENTKLIVATNKPINEFSFDFDEEIIEPCVKYSGEEPVVLERPAPYDVTYETYHAAGQGNIPVLVPLGGDGTVSWHLNEMDSYYPGTILAPFPAGTANDISTTLNGKKPQLKTLLKNGHLKEAYPLLIKNEDETRQALGYIGLGITGHCADVINGRKSTNPSKFFDGLSVFKGLKRSKKFRLHDENEELKIRELVALNTRMATFLWPKKERISIFDRHFNLVIAKGYASAAQLALKGLSKKIEGKRVEAGEIIEFEKPADTPPLIGQTDGETFYIEKGEVKISKRTKPIKIFSLGHFLAR